MSIANELSSDVAVAVLTHHKNFADAAPADARKLTSVILEVYSTLQRLTFAARENRRSQIASPPAAKRATTGDH